MQEDYFIVYAMILVLERFPDNFEILRDIEKVQGKTVLLMMFLILPIYYILRVDPNSTFRIILITYAVFPLFFLRKIKIKNEARVAIAILAGTAVYFVVGAIFSYDLFSAERISFKSLFFFFSNSPQQWFYEKILFIPAIGILIALVHSIQSLRNNFIPAFIIMIYSVSLLFLLIFHEITGFNIHPRFAISAQFWYIPIVALSLYGVWVYLKVLFKKKIFLLISTLLLVLLTFNVKHIFSPILFSGEYMPISDMVHNDFSETQAYLIEHANEGDALVAGTYQAYRTWEEVPDFAAIYGYGNFAFERYNLPPDEYVKFAISQHETGWLVLDDLRLDLTNYPIPLKDTIWGEKRLDYIGRFSSQYIWYWDENIPNNH